MTEQNKQTLNYTCGLLIGLATNMKDKTLAETLCGAAEAISNVVESEKNA